MNRRGVCVSMERKARTTISTKMIAVHMHTNTVSSRYRIVIPSRCYSGTMSLRVELTCGPVNILPLFPLIYVWSLRFHARNRHLLCSEVGLRRTRDGWNHRPRPKWWTGL